MKERWLCLEKIYDNVRAIKLVEAWNYVVEFINNTADIWSFKIVSEAVAAGIRRIEYHMTGDSQLKKNY
jgi:alanyl-tRNA synthetase